MKTAFISAAVFAASNAMAAAPIDGWYASAFGGYTYMPGNLSVTVGGLALNDNDYTSGFNAGGRIGFQSYPLRYEAEVTYMQADLDKLYINYASQLGADGENSATLAMANIYYDFPEMVPAVMPFLGVGIGYGWVDGHFHSVGPAALINYQGNDGVFAYQLMAGLTYNFSENYAANIGYRYVSSDRVQELGKVFEAHSASIGVIYRFDEGIYK